MAKAGGLLVGGLFGLVACNPDRAEPPVEETAAAPVIEPAEPEAPLASIMRPDVQTEPVEEAPLQPLQHTVSFAKGGDHLSDEAVASLEEAIESDQIKQGWPIILRGHADTFGSDEGNFEISRRRASAVADWLEDHGIAAKRITIIPLGEHRPLAPDVTPEGEPDEEGRAQNRRVTMTVVPPAEKAAPGTGAERRSKKRMTRKA